MNKSREAKARAELEVDRLTKLCSFKDTQIASLQADVERFDSLQLHNAELLDKIALPEIKRGNFNHHSHSFADEVTVLKTRANTFEKQVQVALEQEATMRVKLHELDLELAEMRESSEKLEKEKARVELELDKLRFCQDVKENEKTELEAASDLAEITVEEYKLEQHLMEVLEDLSGKYKYFLDLKCREINRLRDDVTNLTTQNEELQRVNEHNTYYTHVYEMLEAQLNVVDSLRENEKSRFERALRSVLEAEFGQVGHLYHRALEKMNRESKRERAGDRESGEGVMDGESV